MCKDFNDKQDKSFYFKRFGWTPQYDMLHKGVYGKHNYLRVVLSVCDWNS